MGMSKFKDRRVHQNLRGEKVTVYIQSHHHQLTLIDVVRSNFNMYVYVFICVEVLGPSQPNGVMSSEVSLPNHTFTGQA